MIEHDERVLLEVRGLKTHFPVKRGVFRKTVGHVRAVDGVSFHVKRGETIGLVGESGSGKTTTGRSIIKLVQPTDGEILYRGADAAVDLAGLSRDQMYDVRREIQMLFQDPYSSLNPRMRVGQIIAEPMEVHRIGTRETRRERVAELLGKVGLNSKELNRYPHQFSGGQRQRIGVARALSLEPKLVICDEPVSALDVSVQAQVLNLLKDLQSDLGLTYIFIAHDLSVVEYISDRIMVMYLGEIVESTQTPNVFHRPAHPYTEALLAAIPNRTRRSRRKDSILQGDIPSPVNPPAGCRFHTRCRYARPRCKSEPPTLRPLQSDPDTLVACHFADQLELKPYVKMR